MVIYYKSHGLTLRLDPEKDPVAIVLNDKDKYNIKHMAEDNDTYCVYPDTIPPKDIKDWLEIVRNLEAEHESV